MHLDQNDWSIKVGLLNVTTDYTSTVQEKLNPAFKWPSEEG